MTVLVGGDTNVDLEIRLPESDADPTHANPDPELFGGGSAANTAAALARLGIACSFVGTVGDDAFGRFAVRSLRDAGVDVAAVRVTKDEPTVTVVAVVKPDGDRLIYVWPPVGGAHAALEPADALPLVAHARWLHVSGICLRLSPAREALLATMEDARDRGIPVSFDLNLRLENWGWEEGFRDVVMAAVDLADVVLGSAADEIVPLARTDDSGEAAAAIAGGKRVVVARLGRSGALAASRDGVTEAPGYEVSVADTLGAGDSFNAGFIAARLEGAAVAGALRWGNAVAALTIARRSARASPTRNEVEAFLAR
jgi:fructokinase/2-dehydro-3-deoxygluconokinase